jgi:maltose O-acetyltransferase
MNLAFRPGKQKSLFRWYIRSTEISIENRMVTEKEKMLAGEMYDATDPQLTAERQRARDLCKSFNASHGHEQELRDRIIGELFGNAGDAIWIEPPFFCDYGANITLGSQVFFNFNCVILDPAPVLIGSNVLFGPAVQICTAAHPMSAAERRTGREFARPIEIGSDVWAGAGAIICPGVRIGSRSVIGAGSVVTRDIPTDVFASGNPCRVIRRLDDEAFDYQGKSKKFDD